MKDRKTIIIVVILLLLLLLFFLNTQDSGGGEFTESGGTQQNTQTNRPKAGEENNATEDVDVPITNKFAITLTENDKNNGFGGDFNDRISREGGKSGDVQIALIWNTIDDLDLHCFDPSNQQIYFGKKRSTTGGELDVDMNAGRTSTEPVENIYWPTGRAPSGTYKVYVVFYARKSGASTIPYKVAINYKGTIETYQGQVRTTKERVLVRQFQVE